ncbi:MAG: alanyl-tRNA editing protein [Candidatus Latescibacterota bacterium]|nr:MAG: alanyl-tRNA editing protein [Candidatus Latescibacterota bacterium]
MKKGTRTERLYLQDPYTVTFQASLLSCEKDPDGRLAAVLDKTYFYPESGGQPSDRGTIAGIEVVDVWEDESGTVYHELAKKIETGTVECEIDWRKRFDHMQQHTGQHILSRAFIEVGKLETVSFHLGEDTCTIDLEGGDLDERAVGAAETLANNIIWENRDVLVKTGTPEETTDDLSRKSVPEGVTEVRFIEVDGFDKIGCCGTHVRRTGELGMIKVLKYEKAKGTFRVYFEVGKRAYDDFAKKHEIIKRLANRFTTAVESIEDKVGKLQSETQRFRKDLQKLSKKLAEYEADRLHKDARLQGGRMFVVELVAENREDYVRLLASCLKSKKDTVSLLGTEDGLVICNAPSDSGIDFSRVVIERAKSLGGGGGGKGAFATARLPASVSVTEFLEEVFENVKNT